VLTSRVIWTRERAADPGELEWREHIELKPTRRAERESQGKGRNQGVEETKIRFFFVPSHQLRMKPSESPILWSFSRHCSDGRRKTEEAVKTSETSERSFPLWRAKLTRRTNRIRYIPLLR